MEKIRRFIVSVRGSMILFFGIGLLVAQLSYLAVSDYINHQAMKMMDPRPSGFFVLDDTVTYVYRNAGDYERARPDFDNGGKELGELNRLQTVRRLAPIPIYGICLIVTAILFYHLRLHRPLEILNQGMERIARRELDYRFEYASDSELGMLCATFEEMQKQLRHAFEELWESEQRQTVLYRSFSHDLRTPLSIIRGNNELIGMLCAEGNSSNRQVLAEVRASARASDFAAERIESYAGSLKELEGAEGMVWDFRNVEMKAFLDQLSNAAGMICGQNNIGVIFDCDVETAYFDPGIVMRILENLIANAVRYAGERVGISIRCGSGELKVAVTDDGPGFSSEALSKGIRPFYSTERPAGHTGLGLAVTDRLVRGCGGSLMLDNLPGSGARVTLIIPEGNQVK